MTQVKVGDRVRVTAHRGGLFHLRNVDKVGVVTSVGTFVRVQFDDGHTDFGMPNDVTLVIKATATLQIGDTVKVVKERGGLFYSHNEGKTGVVSRVDEVGHYVWVQFDGETDYGRITDVVLVKAKEADEDDRSFISNRLNTTGTLPVAKGTLVDILYKDGTIILKQPAGSHDPQRSHNAPHKSYSNFNWRFSAVSSYNSDASIVGYRLSEPEVKAERVVGFKDFVVGMRVRLTSEGDKRHQHWGFRKGEVYNCINGGVVSSTGATCKHNWAEWEFVAVVDSSLDAQLAALRANLEAVKGEATVAQRELTQAQERVTTKEAVVAEIEARRVALVTSITKHGIQFIGEGLELVKASAAHKAGLLKVGTSLKVVVSDDDREHTVGQVYKIISVDKADNNQTYKLESNDGYGWWIHNSSLDGYVVVA